MFKILKLELKGVGKFQNIFNIEFNENKNSLDLLIKDGKSTIIKSIINVLGFTNIDDNKYLKSYNYDGESYIQIELLFNNRNLIIKKNLHTNEITHNDIINFELFDKYKDVLKNNSIINENNLFEIKNIDVLKEEINAIFNMENLILNNTNELMYVRNVLGVDKIYSKEEYDSKLTLMEEDILKKITKKEKLLLTIKETYSKLDNLDVQLEEINENDYLTKLDDSLLKLEEVKKEIFFYRNNLKIKSLGFGELKDFLIHINESNLFNKNNLEKIVSFFNLIEFNLTKYSNLHIDLIKEILNDEVSISILEKLSILENEIDNEEEYYKKFKEIFKPHKENILINKIFEIFENDFEQMVIIYLKYKEIVNLTLWEKIKQFHKSEDFFIIFDKRNNLLNYIKNIIFYLSNNEAVIDKNIMKYLDEQNSKEDFDINLFKINCRQINLLFDDMENIEKEVKIFNEKKEIYDRSIIEKKEINESLLKDYGYLIDNEDYSIKDNLIKNIEEDKSKYKELQNIKNNYTVLVNTLLINKEKNDMEKQKMLLEIDDIIIKVFNKFYSENKTITIENNLILLNGMPFEISKNEDKLLYKILYNYIYNMFLNINVETSILLIDNILSYIKNNDFNIDDILLNSEEILKSQIIYSK